MIQDMLNRTILGIDIGSVSVAVVQCDLSGKILKQKYSLHHGNPRKKLSELMHQFELDARVRIVSPGAKIKLNQNIRIFDPQVALIKAVKSVVPDVRSILHVGAEKFFLISLDQEGNYEYTARSSSCAAGTGSFLDQQSKRLHLNDSGELAGMAMKNRDNVPDIASRCAVFAKTDLIHAQQQGFSLGSICDSLCRGLAENITDTLFNKHDPVKPMIMSGGVSMNASVARHLERLLETPVIVPPEGPILMALGACLLALESGDEIPFTDSFIDDIIESRTSREYFYPPLAREPEMYPNFRKHSHYIFNPVFTGNGSEIQVDLYREITLQPGNKAPVSLFLGIDIGSTSTKAILIDEQRNPIAGFYTYTSGQPLKAVQSIMEAIDSVGFPEMNIKGCGTTGSGRKFVGKIIGADMIYDEITAHARAAYELNPETDTIIEIGGQDAKFTLMKDGVVTFSQMNTVCAAGTGSFIEELAGKLDIPLHEYSSRCKNVSSPLASDRCTVFMERDINQLLSQGYSVDEVLVTVLHSVRENYLKKVANEAQIGDHICFQGATAKNSALVSAFEQRLGKKIYVSEFCHLTGALGTAILLTEEQHGSTKFRGLGIYRKNIPITTEICDLCLNHCLVSLARINGEQEAYGFLCGRDYEVKKYINPDKAGFDLLKSRSLTGGTGKHKKPVRKTLIGIPASLHMMEDLDFWKDFFADLSFPILTSEKYKDSLREGKRMAGAEFCAPVDAMYGHVAYLKEKVDYIFMPSYLESRTKPEKTERNYCYYTQFSSSLAFLQGKEEHSARFISPLLNFNKKREHLIMQLHRSLNSILPGEILFEQVSRAFLKSEKKSVARRQALTDIFKKEFDDTGDISVVCLGRPYVVLSEVLNKGIPDIFSKSGIKAFYQDMIPPDNEPEPGIEKLTTKIPWHFAAMILHISEKVARTPGLYPVFITAFKCAPDSFITEYFKQIMHLYNKPYLIIQIDEHDSNVGYETRIEAALRSFRNHKAFGSVPESVDLSRLLPEVQDKLDGKTLLMPNWDTFISPLVVANLQRSGIDCRLLHSSDLSIRRSMAHNTGQCLPINIITQDYIDYIEKENLDPENAILWMMEGYLTCNIRQYPYYIKKLLTNYGHGLEKASVYSGKITHTELSLQTTYHAYFAYMLGGLFRRVACRIRPYEKIKGQTDQMLDAIQSILVEMFKGRYTTEEGIDKCLKKFDSVEYDTSSRKPLVAIFGDFYVRDNDIMNQDLIRDIESAGGEVVITPYHDYVKITIENVLRRALARGEVLETSMNRVLIKMFRVLDDRYYKPFVKYLGPPNKINPRSLEKNLAKFNIDLYHSGESYDNILKIFYLVDNYPELALFVQTNPAYCCPSLVTEAMTHKIREITGIPVVTITYDGTSEKMNEVIIPYIQIAGIPR